MVEAFPVPAHTYIFRRDGGVKPPERADAKPFDFIASDKKMMAVDFDAGTQ